MNYINIQCECLKALAKTKTRFNRPTWAEDDFYIYLTVNTYSVYAIPKCYWYLNLDGTLFTDLLARIAHSESRVKAEFTGVFKEYDKIVYIEYENEMHEFFHLNLKELQKYGNYMELFITFEGGKVPAYIYNEEGNLLGYMMPRAGGHYE